MMYFGVGEKAGFEHEHPTGLHCLSRTGGLVGLEVLWESLLELQRDASAHDADAIDRVDERLGVRLKGCLRS